MIGQSQVNQTVVVLARLSIFGEMHFDVITIVFAQPKRISEENNVIIGCKLTICQSESRVCSLFDDLEVHNNEYVTDLSCFVERSD